MTDYIRIKHNGYYFEYSRRDTVPHLYFEDVVSDDIMELLDERASKIRTLADNYYSIFREENNEYYDSEINREHVDLIELEDRLDKEYEFKIDASNALNKTPRERYVDEPVFTDQMGEICTKCGRIISLSERRPYVEKGFELIQNGNQEEGFRVYATCPYCKEKALVVRGNIYEELGRIEDYNRLELIDEGKIQDAIDSGYKSIEIYSKIDPFYADIFEDIQAVIGCIYSGMVEMKFDIGIDYGQRALIEKAINYLEIADNYRTLYEPHDLLQAYVLLTFSLAQDPEVQTVTREEINEIKLRLDALADKSIYLYQSHPELIDEEECNKEKVYCEKIRIQGRIELAVTMDRFHYPLYELEAYIKEIRTIINNSSRIDEEEKSKFRTSLPELQSTNGNKKGCYVATAVYGSYDCSEVCTLRKFRDEFLSKRKWGQTLIKLYYRVSPKLVVKLGHITWIREVNKFILDKLVNALVNKGYGCKMYVDQ